MKPKKTKKELLLKLIMKNKLFPQRFLIVDKGVFIYGYGNKKLTQGGYVENFFDIFACSKSFCDRGKILNDLLRLEFLISQIIVIKMYKKKIDFFNYPQIKKINNYVDGFNFFNKIEMLYFADLISEDDKIILHSIRTLRNQPAHSISDKHLEYEGKNIIKNDQFDVFKRDIEVVWENLVESYNNIWSTEDMIDYTIKLIEKKYAK